MEDKSSLIRQLGRGAGPCRRLDRPIGVAVQHVCSNSLMAWGHFLKTEESRREVMILNSNVGANCYNDNIGKRNERDVINWVRSLRGETRKEGGNTCSGDKANQENHRVKTDQRNCGSKSKRAKEERRRDWAGQWEKMQRRGDAFGYGNGGRGRGWQQFEPSRRWSRDEEGVRGHPRNQRLGLRARQEQTN